MDSVKVEVTGARQVGVRFEEFPDHLYEALRAEIHAIGDELLELVKAATPQKTGKLRSEERLRVFADKNRIKAQVDVSGEFAKAGALEYGAHRATKVGSHSMRLDHAWNEKFDAPESVLVGAYTRTPNIEEHAFERGPLHEMQAAVLTRLNETVAKAAGEANA